MCTGRHVTLLQGFQRDRLQFPVVGTPAEPHHAADIGRYGGGIERPAVKQFAETACGVLDFVRLKENHAVLGHDDTSRRHQVFAGLIEVKPEQDFTGTDRIG